MAQVKKDGNESTHWPELGTAEQLLAELALEGKAVVVMWTPLKDDGMADESGDCIQHRDKRVMAAVVNADDAATPTTWEHAEYGNFTDTSVAGAIRQALDDYFAE